MTHDNDWVSVKDELPKKSGRYQVVMKTSSTYHVTMRKFYLNRPHYFTGWEKGTGGVTHWKPMSDLPAGLKQNKEVLGHY